MAQEYEYGFLPQDERYLGLLGNLFSPMRRPIIEAPETTYLDADGVLYPQYSEGVYGEPEFGLEYMPAYQAIAGLLSDPVETAKAMPEAMRQSANEQILAGLDIATGGTGELVTEEGDRISFDPLAVPATSTIAPAVATARALPNETILGSGYGKIGHNQPPVVVGKTPYIVRDELRGVDFKTGLLSDGSRVLLDADGNPYMEPKRINKLLTGTPIEEMSSVRLPPAPGLLVDKVRVSPEDFEGQWMVQAAGDRTGYGDLVSMNDQPLYGATSQQGGDDFMRSKRGAWSSASSAISSMANQVELLRQGKRSRPIIDPVTGKQKTIIEDIPENQRYDFDAPVNLVTSNMAERSADFSLDTAETIARALPGSKIKAADRKAFDDEIKSRFPDYPGSKDPDKLIKWLQKDAQTKGAGARRLKFVETVAMGKAQKAGFPDIGSVRAAVSLPETRFMPYGRTGGAISLLAPEGGLPVVRRLADLENPHPTYPDIIGEPDAYRGGYGITLDRYMAFPDAYAEKIAAGQEPAGIRRAIDIGREAQFMYPEVVDTQMKFIEDQERLLREMGLLNY